MPLDVLTGVVEWWADEELRDVGRRRFHGRSDPPLISLEPEDDDGPSGHAGTRRSPVDSRAVFAARRVPWRLTEISLGSAEEDLRSAVVSWAGDATAVLKGHPAEQSMPGSHETWGDMGLRQMLEPAALEALVPQSWPAAFRVAGELLDRDLSVVPALVSLASDHYEATYDPRLDVLISWSALMDGEVAQRISLTQLTTVEPDGGGPAPETP